MRQLLYAVLAALFVFCNVVLAVKSERPSSPDAKGQDITTCSIIEQMSATFGFDDTMFMRYCSEKCSFAADIECDVALKRSYDFSKFAEKYFKVVEKARQERNFALDDSVIEEMLDVQVFKDFWNFFTPLAVVFIIASINMVGGEKYSWIPATLAVMASIWLALGYEITISAAAIIPLIGAGFANSRTDAPFALSVSCAFLAVMFVLGMWVEDFNYQLTLIALFGVLLVYVVRKYMAGRGHDALTGVMIISLFVMMAPLLRNFVGRRNRNGLILQTIIYISSVMMPFGQNTWALLNNWQNTGRFVLFLERYILVSSELFYVLLCLSFVLLMVPRMALGWAVVHKMRKVQDGPQVALLGAYLYCIDVFRAPLKLIGLLGEWITGGNVRTSEIRYYAMVTLLTVIEYTFGRDIIYLRIAICIFDYAMVKQDFRYAQRFIGVEVILNTYVFPKKGSFPWFDAVNLAKIVGATKVVIADGKRGVGMLRAAGGNVALMTVRHVSVGASRLKLNGVGDYAVVNVKELGTSQCEDPVVSISSSFESTDAVDICVLARSERVNVVALMVVNPTGAVSNVTDFKFQEDDLVAMVNLKSGDSGSPVIGLLRDGTFRYCGAVSRGAFSDGTGNFISLAETKASNGSPGYVGRQLEVPLHLNQSVLRGEKEINVLVELKKKLKPGADTPSARYRFNKQVKDLRMKVDDLITICCHENYRAEILNAFDSDDIVVFNKIRSDKMRPGLGYKV